MKDFEDRMRDLREKRLYCLEERNYAMTIQDWPRVTVFKRKLVDCDEMIARLRHSGALRGKVTKMENQRVEIPAYTDHWMKGDRCGEIVRTYFINTYKDMTPIEVARVKLDKSGKCASFVLADCRLI